MNANREKWIEAVLNSADKLERSSFPTVAKQVLVRVRSHSMSPVSPAIVWRMAASVLVLLALNIAVVYSYHIQKVQSSREIQLQSLAKEYGLGDNNSESVYE